jgi:hypothetical protein
MKKFRSDSMLDVNVLRFEAKWPNFKLKTWREQQ